MDDIISRRQSASRASLQRLLDVGCLTTAPSPATTVELVGRVPPRLEHQAGCLARSGIGSALLFPHPRRSLGSLQPVTRHLAGYWLKRAFELAKVPRPEGSLWHMFRRGWATTRKHLPPKDVAAAGGWRDIGPRLTCYQQPDADTLRQVVEYEEPRSTPASPSREQSA